MMYSKEILVNQFKELGLVKGDVVLVRAALNKLGRLSGGPSIILDSLKEVVGESGTIVALGFSKMYFRFFLKPDLVYTVNTPSNAGALAKLFMADKNCKRSAHPTNSFLAIGPKSTEILEDHGPLSKSYSPMNKLLELNAKMIVFGCVDSSPGFTTVHLAQENLGLTSKSWFLGWFGQYYLEDGKLNKYIKKDFGGCSAGFGKFYSDYIKNECLKTGRIGSAYAIAINCSDAYKIEYEKIRRDVRYHLCSNPTCVSCRLSWRNNIRGIPKFLVFYCLNFLKSKMLK